MKKLIKSLAREFLLLSLLMISVLTATAQTDKSWAWTGFHRPPGINPVISPDTSSVFLCPMSHTPISWEYSDTFNPAATIINGRVAVLYRAEDRLAQGIGRRTSRIGYASSADGLHFQRHGAPVMYPGDDSQAENEIPGGCEDPRVCMAEDGTYVMMYTLRATSSIGRSMALPSGTPTTANTRICSASQAPSLPA